MAQSHGHSISLVTWHSFDLRLHHLALGVSKNVLFVLGFHSCSRPQIRDVSTTSWTSFALLLQIFGLSSLSFVSFVPLISVNLPWVLFN